MTQQEMSFGDAPGVTLFGVGGAGGNAVARLFRQPELGMKIVCANTDVQALRAVPSTSQLQLGRRLTGGLGAGAKPEIGRAAAREALPEIVEALQGTGLCFIAAGLGGGTGTGAAPVIARAARERGILTIGIATRPFAFEGTRRARIAAAGVAEFEESVDALVVVCNENLLHVAGPDTTFRSALQLSDSIVCDSATDFAALIAGPALKRVTIADIRATLKSGGRTVIGYGERCAGTNRAILAAQSALRNPLLEDASRGAQRLLVTIAGGSDLGLFEVEEAVDYLRENTHAGVDLVWGSVIDPALEGRMRIGITAAGLPAPGAFPEHPPMAVARTSAKASFAAARPVRAFLPEARPAPAVEPAIRRSASAVMDLPAAPGILGVSVSEPVTGAPMPAAPDYEIEPSVLVLTSTYSLGLDIVADRPLMAGPIRSRGNAASLVDRIYFASRDLKRSWRHGVSPGDRPMPRKIPVGRGVPRLAAI